MVATGEPNQRIAAGCTPSATQRSSAETIGQDSVAGGLSAAGMVMAVVAAGPRIGPSGGTARDCGGGGTCGGA